MLENEYRLEIQFKKVQKIRNINNIPTVGSRPLECKPAQNGLYMVFKLTPIWLQKQLVEYFHVNTITLYFIEF